MLFIVYDILEIYRGHYEQNNASNLLYDSPMVGIIKNKMDHMFLSTEMSSRHLTLIIAFSLLPCIFEIIYKLKKSYLPGHNDKEYTAK